ncbi:MAG TPA: DUF3828 domain-containing protein [Pyrinomonadaceae bacterium]|nr:DUF3828 domain-containing protein [Pyrinomonadaceae bacterium]
MTKRIAKILFIALLLISGFSCAAIKPEPAQEETKPTAEQNSSEGEIAAAQASSSSNSNPAQQISPDALVKDLYKVHGQDFENQSERILDGKSRRLLDKYFDKNLADLFWKDLTLHQEEVGVIDFDPFYNAQDIEIKNLSVGKAQIEGEKATVAVTFNNYSQKETVTYLLAKKNGAWKISDIRYKSGDTLLKYFKENAQSEASNRNFEGTYQVGETTATVKPVKMAFELRWAKGSGVMMFFFEGKDAGKYRFSSEDTGKGKDTFVFDNESSNAGKFIRADCKEMPVRKIK